MDPLTHTLTGAALASTGLGRRTRFGAVALVVGANLPDIDALAYLRGADAGLAFRRGWTHGVAAWIVLPLILSAILLALDRRLPAGDGRRADGRTLLWLSALGVLSHPLLDWLNTYGIRLLMPFDDRWFYGDALFIVDPWLWLVLGTAVALSRRPLGRFESVAWLALSAAALALLTGSGTVPTIARWLWVLGLAAAVAIVAAGAARRRRPGRAAVLGLTIAALYVGSMIVSERIAAERVRAALPALGVDTVERLMVGPRPADPLRRDVVVETGTGYRYGTFDWRAVPPLVLDPRRLSKPGPEPGPVVEAALRAPSVRGFVGWMRFPFVEIETDAAGSTVHLIDARYARRPGVSFGTAVARVEAGSAPRE